MQVSVEATSNLERRMKVQVPAEQIESEVDQRLRRVGKTAKLKGFRPGKVPFKVIQKEYGSQVRREVLSEVMQSSFTEAITKENLRPAGGPRIEATAWSRVRTCSTRQCSRFIPKSKFRAYPISRLRNRLPRSRPRTSTP